MRTVYRVYDAVVQEADERAKTRVSAAAIGHLGKLLETSRLQQISDFRPLIEKIAARKERGNTRRTAITLGAV